MTVVDGYGEQVRLVATVRTPMEKAAGPPGGGWQPVPGTKHGGYRRRRRGGSGYDYWYPSTAGKAALHEEGLHGDMSQRADATRAKHARAAWKRYQSGELTAGKAAHAAHVAGGGRSDSVHDAAEDKRHIVRSLLKQYRETDDPDRAMDIHNRLYSNFGIHPEGDHDDEPMEKAADRPAGGGWEPVPGGKHGGYRKRGTAGHYVYWYPSRDVAMRAAEHHASEVGRRHADIQQALSGDHSDAKHAAMRDAQDQAHHHAMAAHAARQFTDAGSGHAPVLSRWDSHDAEHFDDHGDDPRVQGHLRGDPADPDHAYELEHTEGGRWQVRHGRVAGHRLDAPVHVGEADDEASARAMMHGHVGGRLRKGWGGAILMTKGAAGALPGMEMTPTTTSGAPWKVDGYECRILEKAGLSILTMTPEGGGVAFNQVLSPVDRRRAMAKSREVAAILRAGKTPDEGVYRNVEVPPARWEG